MTSVSLIEDVSGDVKQQDLTGQLINHRYCLLGVIGSGGMATVYRASDTQDGREVALKVLDPKSLNPAHRERFLRECRLTAQLSHENIVHVFDTGESEGVSFIAMELLRGRTLAAILVEERTLGWQRVIELTRQIGAGLAFAHQLGLVHRDLKPANCFLEGTESTERIKLLDFGLAKQVTPSEGEPEVTGGSEILGSPTYMAPEQARGEARVQTDIYSLGVMLFRMLAGRPPFTANNPVDVIVQHAHDPVPWLRDVTTSRDVPNQLEQVVRRCLEKDPSARYATVELLRQALDEAELRALTGAPRPRAPPPREPTPPPLPRISRPLPMPVTAPVAVTETAPVTVPARPPTAQHVPPVLYPTPLPTLMLAQLRRSWGWRTVLAVTVVVVTVATMTAAASVTVGARALKQSPRGPEVPSEAAQLTPPVEAPPLHDAPVEATPSPNADAAQTEETTVLPELAIDPTPRPAKPSSDKGPPRVPPAGSSRPTRAPASQEPKPQEGSSPEVAAPEQPPRADYKIDPY